MAVVHARRQAALDAYYAEHPERFPKGRPIAKTPPAQVCINPDDGVTVAAEAMSRNSTGGEYAHSPVVTLEKMN